MNLTGLLDVTTVVVTVITLKVLEDTFWTSGKQTALQVIYCH